MKMFVFHDSRLCYSLKNNVLKNCCACHCFSFWEPLVLSLGLYEIDEGLPFDKLLFGCMDENTQMGSAD